jgi:hypothetical protein
VVVFALCALCFAFLALYSFGVCLGLLYHSGAYLRHITIKSAFFGFPALYRIWAIKRPSLFALPV